MKPAIVVAFLLGAGFSSYSAIGDEPQSRGAVGIQVSQNNSTTVALGANATFVGQTDDVLHYQEVDLNMKGGPSNASGTLFFEFSPDGVNWDVSIPLPLPNPNSLVPIPLRIVLPFFRVRYVNGAVAQTSFRLTVVYHNISGNRLTRFPFQMIDPNEPTEVTHSLTAGQRPDGTYSNAVLDTASRFSVSVANFPAVQPVSGTVAVSTVGSIVGTVTVGGTVAATQSGAWAVAATQSGAWTVGVSGTVTVAGTVTANQGTAAAHSGAWPMLLTTGGVASFGGTTNPVQTVVTNTPSVNVANQPTVNQGNPAADPSSWPIHVDDRFGVPFNTTPFGEWRVANPYTLTDITNKYELDYRVWGTTTTGGGSVAQNQNQAAVTASVTSASGAHAQLRTNSYFRYQSGKSLRWRMSIYHVNAGDANQTRSWGFFDDNDGLFYQLVGTALSIIQRSSVSGSVVNTTIAQSSWNVDKMDGTGPSGVTLDVTKGNIYEAALQWLGVGNVQFFIDGFLVHQIKNANVNATAYMKSAQLPLTVDIVNTGASTAASISNVCASVVSEGGAMPPSPSFGAYNPSDLTIGATEAPLIAIRPKLTYQGIANRMLIVPRNLITQTNGARAGWRLLVNPTVTGGTWVSADPTSGVEYNITATSFSGGTTLLRGFLPNQIDHDNVDLTNLFEGLDDSRKLHVNAYDTSQDVLLITGQNEAGGTTLMRGSLAWEEIR